MTELLRFRTRDNRYLSGGIGGQAGGGLHVVGGPPTFLETFVALDESTLPVVDGGSIALAICDTNFQATNKLALLVSHTERIGNGPLVRIVFGGPGTNANVWVEDWGVRPPTSSNPLWMNLFTVAATASPAEVSLRVIDRSTWYFRVADDDYVYADGTQPFQNDTAFIIERGPFDCAAVRGRVIDSKNKKPLPGTRGRY